MEMQVLFYVFSNEKTTDQKIGGWSEC